jgi:hypothetical protein
MCPAAGARSHKKDVLDYTLAMTGDKPACRFKKAGFLLLYTIPFCIKEGIEPILIVSYWALAFPLT